MVNMLNLALPSHATKHEGPLVFMKSKPLIVPNYSFFDKHPQGDFINLKLNLNTFVIRLKLITSISLE